MFISNLKLKNWRNFREADVPLSERTFVVGPNACGKSNLLDVFRFLRDIAQPGGGLQKAVSDRGGLPKIRSLAARRYPSVEIEIRLSPIADGESSWTYALGMRSEKSGRRRPLVEYERVWNNRTQVVDRPDDDDRRDLERLTQTHLEQINSNQRFRDIAKFLEDILYLHLVPQLVRQPDAFAGPGIPTSDPFGRNFLERVARTPKKTRRSRLGKIERALKIAVPQLKNLADVTDKAGVPHLEATYEHWRPNAGKQREDQFSDGTVRLIGLLWALLESEPLLLLEEPEIFLNAGIVKHLPSVMYRLQRRIRKQIIVSTHSYDLLTDRGIGAEEVLMLTPSEEGTEIEQASNVGEIRNLLHEGMPIADAIQPRVAPRDVRQLQLFS